MLKTDLAPYIDDIVNRRVTNRAVAAALGVNESSVSRTLKTLGVQREPVQHGDEKKLRATRREFRAHVAKTLPIEQAARAAGVTTRTIYRLRNK